MRGAGGREVQEGLVVCRHTADSWCCTAESNFTPTKKNKCCLYRLYIVKDLFSMQIHYTVMKSK